MKIIFHERFYEVYTADPAASAGRMEPIIAALGKDFEVMPPSPASDQDIASVHTHAHIQSIKRHPEIYEVAALSAGSAILASDIAMEGEPAFGVIRPPGHHASPDSCWGFCYFNNLALAVQRLFNKDRIKNVLILDFDLHFGDGTENAFLGNGRVNYFHPEGNSGEDFVKIVENRLGTTAGKDVIAVSAGFDRHVEDWGGLLSTEDYRKIGSLVKAYSLKNCGGRRFAVLEGGYNHAVLGHNVRAFIEGMR